MGRGGLGNHERPHSPRAPPPPPRTSGPLVSSPDRLASGVASSSRLVSQPASRSRWGEFIPVVDGHSRTASAAAPNQGLNSGRPGPSDRGVGPLARAVGIGDLAAAGSDRLRQLRPSDQRILKWNRAGGVGALRRVLGALRRAGSGSATFYGLHADIRCSRARDGQGTIFLL